MVAHFFPKILGPAWAQPAGYLTHARCFFLGPAKALHIRLHTIPQSLPWTTHNKFVYNKCYYLVNFVAHKHRDNVVFCRVRLELIDPLVQFHKGLLAGHVIHWKQQQQSTIKCLYIQKHQQSLSISQICLWHHLLNDNSLHSVNH